MRKASYFIAIVSLALGITLANAGDDDHGTLDAFMAEAAALLPPEPTFALSAQANAQVATPADRATYGEWGPLLPWPFIPVTAANLPDGRIVSFASNERTNFPVGPEFTYAGVWNPTTGEHTEINNDNHDMFCAAPAMGIDGKPIFPGGRNSVRFTTVFDYENDAWVRVEDMNDGRWYAASTTLPNGSILTASGNRGTGINTVERYTAGSGWTRLLGVPWNGIQTKAFPHNFVAPDGRIIYAGPAGNMMWIDTTGSGQLTSTSAIFPGNRIDQSGGVLMYDIGKILFAGGGVSGGGTTNVAHAVDINSATPLVTAVAPMQFNRRYHNALMLPDGKPIMIGGNSSGLQFRDTGTIYAPETWDPTTDSWQELADMSKPRNYHSVALMLPDGRVFSGGGGLSSYAPANHQDAQIFSPPYLFNPDGSPATRPTITAAPEISSPGNTIQIAASPSMARFTMIRMTATTHAFSSDVRFLNVPFTATAAGQYELALHPNVNVLLPGYWMIFALDAQGTPSEASIIKISAPTPPTIDSPGNQYTLLNHLASFTIPARDGDGDPLTFSATGLPAGTQIASNTGIVSGSPQQPGTFAITVSVADGTNTSSTDFDWIVTEDPGLIAHWSFDEADGDTVQDVGDLGADGTMINGARRVAGIQGGAVSFNGVDEHIKIDNQAALEVGKNGSDFSLSFWINLKQDTTSQYRSIMHKGGANEQRTFALWLYPNTRRIQFAVSTDLHTTQGSISTNQLPFEEWAHVAMVKSGNQLTLFLDGEADKAYEILGEVISNSGSIYLGDSPWALGTQAELDEFALYNRALSSSEITFLSDPTNRVIGANSPPILTSPGNLTSPLAPISVHLNTIDTNGDALTYTSEGQLPPGLSLNASTGLISGTPTTPGTYNQQITVTDGLESSSISFQWQIIEQITATPVVPGPIQAGNDAVFSIDASGQNPSYTWDFGDGSGTVPSTSGSITHNYSQPGRYTVTVTVSDTLGQAIQLSFRQSIHAAITTDAPGVSQSLAFEDRPGGGRVWNVNPDNHTVSVFNAVTHAKIAEIPVGQKPRSIAIAPDGQIWVTNKKSATISRISPSSLSVISTINLPRASQPHAITFSQSRAYVSLEATGKLVSFNPTTGLMLGSAVVGTNPRHLSVNHDGSKVYVSRFITPPANGEATATPTPLADEGGEIVVVTTSNMLVADTIILHPSARPDASDGGRGIPNYVGPAAISPDGTSAWVGSKQDNIQRGIGRDGNPLTHDSTVRSITSRIDLTSGTEDPAQRVDHDNGGIASTTIFGRYGNLVFSALEGSRHVAITDVYNLIEIKRIIVERAPQGLAISPDGRTLYVHNFMSRSVTAHDISEIVDGTSEDVGLIATYNTVASEALAANVLLGKQHFYDAQDTRLALQGYISCASCHNDGAQDGRVWDLTGFGEGLRNTIDLRGRAGTGHGPLHWSANFDEIQDFEGQIRNLAGGGGLISEGNPHPSLGMPNAGRSADLDALAAYVASLATFDESPQRNTDGSLSSNASAGKALFASNNCASCHGGEAFTDSSPGTLHDIGTIKPTSGNRLGGLLDGLDTPTLRGVASGAPYLHDGSAETIEAAITAHDSSSFLTPAEIIQIASYLREIDGSEPAPPATTGSDEITPAADTIALYHFNTDFNDAGQNDLDLTTGGGVALTSANLAWMQSPSGKVARFTKVGDTLSVSIPDSLLLASGGTPLSIEARIYPRAYLAYSIGDLPVIALHQEWDTHLQLEDSKWSSGPAFSANGGTLADTQQWATSVTPNAWHRIQISFDGTHTIKLWIDGILTNTVELEPNIDRSNDWTLTLGNFDGDLDEVHISRAAIDPNPDTTPPTGGGDETSPTAQTAALFHFNTGFSDASSNGINLTTNGGVQLTDTNLGWMQNPTGKAVRFTNIGDTLTASLPDSLILPSNGTPITIEARIYPRAYLGYGVENLPVIALHQGWDAHLQLEDSKWGSNPRGPELFAAGAVLANAQQWSSAATLNQWHHLQISYDGVGTVSSWLDGAPLSAVNISLNVDRNSDWTLTLGNFDGDIDELHIHTIAAPPGAPTVGSQSAAAAAVSAYNLTHGSNITQPLDGDSDGDGWIDLFEVAHGTKADVDGAPAYQLTLVDAGGQIYSAYSVPVQVVGTPISEGFLSAAFTYRVESTSDLETWDEPVEVVANPSTLPPPPAGYKFITFRSSGVEGQRTFFRTTVIENP